MEALPHNIGFSHELPTYNTQQYYELIGKYSQFKYGWDTYVAKDGTRYGDDGYDLNVHSPTDVETMLTIAEKRMTNIIRQG